MGDYILSAADYIIFLILGLLIPILSIYQGKPELGEVTFDTKSKIRLYYSNGLVLWIGVFFIILTWIWNDRSLIDLGFGMPHLTGIAIIFSLILIIGYVIDVLVETLIPKRKSASLERWKTNTPFLPSNFLEYRHFIFAAFSAAFCEEVIFRGFFINFVLAFTHNTDIGIYSAIVLPALLFGVMHIYQGHVAILKIILGGILFGLIFYISKSLWIPIIIHFIIDMIGGYLSIRYAKELEVDQDIQAG